MKKLAPSILSADFSRLGEEIKAVEEAGADYIHIDVMDGHFVPNITVGPLVVETAKTITSLPLDVHLMISDPDRYIKDFVQAGSDLLSVHVETCPHLQRTLTVIREQGAKAAVVLNPSTPLAALEYIRVLAGRSLYPPCCPRYKRYGTLLMKRTSQLNWR